MIGLRRAEVLTACSAAPSPAQAAAELQAAIDQPDMACVLFFCSADQDFAAVAAEMTQRFPETLMVGCSTAGEIGPSGYAGGSVAALSLPAAHFTAVAAPIAPLSGFDLPHGHALVSELVARLERAAPRPVAGHTFALLLIDGMSGREEWVVSSLALGLGDIPLFGGSAGDQLRFGRTHVCLDGAVQTDAAVLLLVNTGCPFAVFRTQHFVNTDKKMVVTGADPTARVVTEINGESAGREYARMVGLDLGRLTPMVFAAYPVVVRVGGVYYVRSIQKVNEDESLSFFCAIDEGIVLTVAEGVDIVDNLEATLADIRRQIGPPHLIIGCDCILRRLEIERKGLTDRISDILAANRVIGFSTYGEQYHAMHVNQTFTGVAIGRPPEDAP